MEVIPVGVESGGFMELPPNPAIAGWYRFGPDPWSPDGNTVISAHIDAPEYPIGPFDRLRDLAADTEVTVTGADGSTAAYGVVSVTYYPKQELPTEALFARDGHQSAGAHHVRGRVRQHHRPLRRQRRRRGRTATIEDDGTSS